MIATDYVDRDTSTGYGRVMGNRTAMWVTVDANPAVITSRVRSTHRTARAAIAAARKAGGREVLTADIAQAMQSGSSHIDAVQFYAGKVIEPARVWVS